MSPSPCTSSIRILILAFLLTAFCTRAATARPFFFRPYFQAFSATGPESVGAKVAMAPASPPKASGSGVVQGVDGNATVLEHTTNATATYNNSTAAANSNGARGAGFSSSSSFILSVVVIGTVGVQLM